MELAPQQLADWAVRLSAYQGVVAARDSLDARETSTDTFPDGTRYIEPTEVGLVGDPIFSSIFDVTSLQPDEHADDDGPVTDG